jgi:hypothetical protein
MDNFLFLVFPMVFTAPLLLIGVPIYLWLRRRATTHPEAWIHRLPSGYRFWLPFDVALLIAPVAGWLATVAYGIGHGVQHPPLFPKYCFPFLFIVMRIFHTDIGGFLNLWGAGIQVVLYGIAIGWCWSRHSFWLLLFLAVVHFLAAWLVSVICPGAELCC